MYLLSIFYISPKRSNTWPIRQTIISVLRTTKTQHPEFVSGCTNPISRELHTGARYPAALAFYRKQDKRYTRLFPRPCAPTLASQSALPRSVSAGACIASDSLAKNYLNSRGCGCRSEDRSDGCVTSSPEIPAFVSLKGETTYRFLENAGPAGFERVCESEAPLPRGTAIRPVTLEARGGSLGASEKPGRCVVWYVAGIRIRFKGMQHFFGFQFFQFYQNF